MRLKRRLQAWAAALVLGLVVAKVAPALTERAGEYDIASLLRQLLDTNAEIGEVNAALLSELSGVRQQSEGVDRLRSRLGRLHGLVGEQQSQLAELRRESSAQADLTRRLAELTDAVRPATAGMAATAAVEAEALERMSRSTAALAATIGRISQYNGETLTKLRRAEELSALVLQRMP